MTADNQTANAREEMRRGNEALRAADELMRLDLCNDAVSRAYYAAYHWARAVLLTKGLESRTHRGVNQLLGLRFVREGLLAEEATRLLASLEDSREAGDYSAEARFAPHEAARAVEQAKAFIALCQLPLRHVAMEPCRR